MRNCVEIAEKVFAVPDDDIEMVVPIVFKEEFPRIAEQCRLTLDRKNLDSHLPGQVPTEK